MGSGSAARLNVYLRDGGYCAETGEFHGVDPRIAAFMLNAKDLKAWSIAYRAYSKNRRHHFARNWTDDEKASYWFRYLYSCRITGISGKLGAWELDHIIPLWKIEHLSDEERFWYFTMENMQTLSPNAHARKTAKEAAERAHFKRLHKGLVGTQKTKRGKRLAAMKRYREMP